jgi:hypothetical protein
LISIEKTIKGDALREGLVEGIEIGEAKGEHNAKREVALAMLKESFPDDMIIKIAKITLEDLVDLKRSV